MRFRGGEFSTGTKGNFQSELTPPQNSLLTSLPSTFVRGRGKTERRDLT